MNVRELRAKHPVFHYQGFKLQRAPGELAISFNFLLEPDIAFQPELRIPLTRAVDEAYLEPLVFNLGLVEAISYWKAACPPKFVVRAGVLSEAQITWWHDLFINGLGEFFYTNNIDFTKPDFLTIDARVTRRKGPVEALRETQDKLRLALALSEQSESKGASTGRRGAAGPAPTGDLILVGGGKDSSVTLELTRNLARRRQAMLLNPTPAMLKVSKLAGFDKPLIVKRTIDQKLLELNRQGYLNGHTPFSAYLAFLGLLVGKIQGFKQIIASNEESASFGNVTFHGQEINHQYSKSYRFEKMFRQYSQDYLSQQIEYFSFLRPLPELQIAYFFSRFRQYFPVFNSCNVGRGRYWCGQCPKCAFVFLVLSPFVTTDQLIKLFGADLLDKEELNPIFSALVGLDGHKPFDCVGTREESIQAVALTTAKYQKEGRELPKNLAVLKEKLGIKEPIAVKSIMENLKSHWNNKNFLPEKYGAVLSKNLKTLGT